MWVINSNIPQRIQDSQGDEDSQQKYLVFMQNLETMGFIIKETMSLDQMLVNLEKIYSRDLQELEGKRKDALSQVKSKYESPVCSHFHSNRLISNLFLAIREV